jgi:hypothetical protein
VRRVTGLRSGGAERAACWSLGGRNVAHLLECGSPTRAGAFVVGDARRGMGSFESKIRSVRGAGRSTNFFFFSDSSEPHFFKINSHSPNHDAKDFLRLKLSCMNDIDIARRLTYESNTSTF